MSIIYINCTTLQKVIICSGSLFRSWNAERILHTLPMSVSKRTVRVTEVIIQPTMSGSGQAIKTYFLVPLYQRQTGYSCLQKICPLIRTQKMHEPWNIINFAMLLFNRDDMEIKLYLKEYYLKVNLFEGISLIPHRISGVLKKHIY